MSLSADLNPSSILTHLPSASIGHYIRLRRIFDIKDGRTIILPFDHGTSHGALPGLENPRRIVLDAIEEKVDTIMLHAGLARRVADLYGNHLATIFALTSSGSALADHVLLGSVEQAVKYSADAVAVEFKLGTPLELEVMRMIGQVKRETERYDMPLLVTAYASPQALQKFGSQASVTACRIAGELGADIIKTNYPATSELFAQMIGSSQAPLVVAGGKLMDDQQLFQIISQAISLGAAGVAIGRNVWGASNPRAVLAKIRTLVHSREPST